ncbi:hypothetical protein NDU88_006548 [Pleurodeles waltl]|uniref:Uncharacterized protein n=1 Tax=Pleurodeles waltl TaxID=8319 RepID=A0AAV7SPY6_PLEWA|nr:hypothetical protein NDU88_006548 [Pleurodeles waltl]
MPPLRVSDRRHDRGVQEGCRGRARHHNCCMGLQTNRWGGFQKGIPQKRKHGHKSNRSEADSGQHSVLRQDILAHSVLFPRLQ